MRPNETATVHCARGWCGDDLAARSSRAATSVASNWIYERPIARRFCASGVGDHIKAITWKNDHGGLDKLGIIPSARGVQFVKRDDEGKLAGLFVVYTCTPTMFGGCRQWFACPDCRRPARVLYGVHSLQCRRCRGLKYASQSEASHWRAQRKALSIRLRVGESGDALDEPFPPKPPKMRWATYERLRAVDAALREQWLLGAAEGLRRLHSKETRR